CKHCSQPPVPLPRGSGSRLAVDCGAASSRRRRRNPRLAIAPLTICECCDALYERRRLAPGETAYCRRCGAELYGGRRFDLDAMLAITLGGLIVFVIANAYPVLVMELGGNREEVTLWGAILATYDAGTGPIAVLAAVSLFVLPL